MLVSSSVFTRVANELTAIVGELPTEVLLEEEGEEPAAYGAGLFEVGVRVGGRRGRSDTLFGKAA